MIRRIIILLFLINIFSCSKKNIENDNVIIETYGWGEEPQIEHKEYDTTQCTIPYIPLTEITSITPIFIRELISPEKISEVISVQENTLYHPTELCIAKNLYFKKNLPRQAGKYKNKSPFIIYDFIYSNEKETNIAFESLKSELKKINTPYNYEYFDYFKGTSYFYFINIKDKKIIAVCFSAVNGDKDYNLLISFCEKYKSQFQEIIYVDATRTEKIF